MQVVSAITALLSQYSSASTFLSVLQCSGLGQSSDFRLHERSAFLLPYPRHLQRPCLVHRQRYTLLRVHVLLLSYTVGRHRCRYQVPFLDQGLCTASQASCLSGSTRGFQKAFGLDGLPALRKVLLAQVRPFHRPHILHGFSWYMLLPPPAGF